MATIGIDYTAALKQGGGIGRYVRSLVYALAQQDTTSTQYRLFAAGSRLGALPPAPGENFRWTPTQIGDQWLVRLWYRLHVPYPVDSWTGKLDLFHAPDFLLPPTRKNTRTVLTVHDLSFVRAPETATDGLRGFLNDAVPRSVRRADHILADSAATKADLIALYGTRADKITVLLSGVEPRFKPITEVKELAAVRAKYGLGDGPLILSLGTIQPRKNYVRLVEAFSQLPQPDTKLVIVGGKGWLSEPLYQRIDELQMTERVIMPGFADDQDLPALYSAASVFAFPSLYEGFGLPVLEAMACGTPVVASNVSSVPEVAGDAALLIDPYDVDQIRDNIVRLLSDETLRKDLALRGRSQVRQFTWDRAAQKLANVYTKLLNA